MNHSRCDVCNRDISKPSLVRCQSSACPLKERHVTASRDLLGGLFALAIALVVVILVAKWMVDQPKSAVAGIGSSSSSGSTTGGLSAWLETLLGKRKPVADSGAPKFDLPDWQAATRVSSFSCDGALSDARRLVCSNWELATTDYNLALVYRNALAKANNAAALRRSQAAWLARLDRQARDKDALMQHYGDRIAELQQR